MLVKSYSQTQTSPSFNMKAYFESFFWISSLWFLARVSGSSEAREREREQKIDKEGEKVSYENGRYKEQRS